MSERKQKKILLCVTGRTPQIITETLYALTQERQDAIDEIRVITTLGGRDQISKALLPSDGGKFIEFCNEYKIEPTTIKFDETCITLLRTPDGRTLEDIRSVEENEIAANQICEIVRELTKNPNTKLHASVAGGRKTMGLYLATAMQLFGRTEDQLSHVLVSEDFESHPDFYYKPASPHMLQVKDRAGNTIKEINTKDAQIHLADIPFIRLRGLMSEWIDSDYKSYSEAVYQAQNDLNLLEETQLVQIDVRRKAVLIASRKVKLKERLFFFYVFFAQLRHEKQDEFWKIAPQEITPEQLNNTLIFITESCGNRQSLNDYDSSRFDFVRTYADQLQQRKKSDLEDFCKSMSQVVSKIKREFEDAELPSRFSINSYGPRGEVRYGMSISPSSIHFV